MKKAKTKPHQKPTLNKPKVLTEEWLKTTAEDGIAYGRIALDHLPYIMAEKADYTSALPDLWEKYQCDLRGPKEPEVTTQHDRAGIWRGLFYRWAFGTVQGVREGLKSIPLLSIYRDDKDTGKLEECVSNRTDGTHVNLQELAEYLTKKIRISLPSRLFPNHESRIQPKEPPTEKKPRNNQKARITYRKEDEIASSEYAFIKVGKLDLGKTYYDLIFKSQTIRLRGLGADYIYYLMWHYKYPDEIDVVQLLSNLGKAFDKKPSEQRDEKIDKKALAQVIKSSNLGKQEEEKLKDIEHNNTELFKKYLNESTTQGIIKTFSSEKDKIIDSVRKAMTNTLLEIRSKNEEAYNHLHTAFKPLNSNPKSYKPTEDIPWKFN